MSILGCDERDAGDALTGRWVKAQAIALANGRSPDHPI
jgi:hypothetical protein